MKLNENEFMHPFTHFCNSMHSLNGFGARNVPNHVRRCREEFTLDSVYDLLLLSYFFYVYLCFIVVESIHLSRGAKSTCLKHHIIKHENAKIIIDGIGWKMHNKTSCFKWNNRIRKKKHFAKCEVTQQSTRLEQLKTNRRKTQHTIFLLECTTCFHVYILRFLQFISCYKRVNSLYRVHILIYTCFNVIYSLMHLNSFKWSITTNFIRISCIVFVRFLSSLSNSMACEFQISFLFFVSLFFCVIIKRIQN